MRVAKTALILSVVLFSASLAEARQKSLLVDLKFVPQEGVRVASVALPMSVIQQPVEIQVVDAREQADPKNIGQGTDDDDRVFPILSSVDVTKYAGESILKIAQSYSIKSGPGRKLTVRVTRFLVNEKNQAVGSTYNAEVHLAYSLSDGAGTVLVDSAASGAANRYGRARSADNCSEVLSDALKAAFIKILGDQSLQNSWKSGEAAAKAGGAAPVTPKESLSIEERLKRAEDLFNKKLITEDEYKKMRADILKSGL